MFSHDVILQHVLSNTLEVTQLTLNVGVQLSTLNIQTMFGGCVLDQILFLRSLEVTGRTIEEGLIEVLLEM